MKTTDKRIQNLTGRPTVEIWSAGSILGSLSLPKGPSAQRGTALVLVVVLLALLAILGTSFVLTTRVERVAVQNQLAAGGMDQAVNSVIEVIKSTLAEDLWGRPEDPTATTDGTKMNAQRLLNLPANSNNTTSSPELTSSDYSRFDTIAFTTGGNHYFLNEPWDAPVTDITGVKFYWYDGAAWNSSDLNVDGDPWLGDSTINTANQVTNLFCVPWPMTTDVFAWSISLTGANTELQADADGDETSDSIWLVQRGGFSENTTNGYAYYTDPVTSTTKWIGVPYDLPIKSSDPNLTYRMAVRIVDTCSMVNVNTAWAWPGIDNAGTVEYMGAKGNSLGGIMLYGNGSTLGPYFGRASTLPGRVFDTLHMSIKPNESHLLAYQNSYIFKIENPDWTALNNLFTSTFTVDPLDQFYPLDLSDELDLRYRWNQNSPIMTTLESKFTTLPPANRPFLTAYSFSRNIRRLMQNKPSVSEYKLDSIGATGISLDYGYKKVDAIYGFQQWIRYCNRAVLSVDEEKARKAFALGLYEVFRQGGADIDRPVGAITEAEAALYTAQYIANLIDVMDTDNIPTILELADFEYGTASNLIIPDWTTVTSQTFVAGIEKHPVITDFYVFRARTSDSQTSFGDDHFQFEVYNPWRAAHGGVINFSSTNTPNNDLSNYYYKINGVDAANNTVPYTDLNSDGIADWIALSGDLDSDNRQPVPHSISGTEIPEKGQIVLACGVDRDKNGTVDFYVVVDSFAFDIGSPANFIAKDPSDPASKDQAGYTWNLILRDDTGWLVHVDQQVSMKDTSHGETPWDHTAAETSNLLVYPARKFGGTNDVTSLATKSFYSWWFADNTSAFNANNADEVRARFSNPNFVTLPFYQGNIEYNGDFDWSDTVRNADNRVSQALSYRMYGLNTRVGEKGIRISFLNTDNLGKYFMEYFTMLDRAADGKDQLNRDGDDDETTNPDNLDEQRMPGLINVNTVPVNDVAGTPSSEVLQALHPYINGTNARDMTYEDRGGGNYRKRVIQSVNDLVSSLPLPASVSDAGVQGVTNDLEEQQLVWSRIANLITTRSDTFAAYIYVQMLDAEGNVVTERREMALFDRSLCNEPPLRWNGTAWEPNPAYRPVKVVARQTIN